MADKKSNKQAEKSIYFTFILYPDSLPEDWKIQLMSTDRPMAISPLHDKDLVDKEVLKKQIAEGKEYYEKNKNTLSSEQQEKVLEKIKELETKPIYKKPHYHLIYIAKNPVTAQAVRNKFKKLLGDSAINKVQIIASSVRNTYAYLTHESVDAVAKKKHVYDKDDIQIINNFDVDRYDELDSADKKELFYTVIDIIKENNIPNMMDLEIFIDENGEDYDIDSKKLRTVIETKTGILRLYFDGVFQRDRRKKEEEREKYEREQAERKAIFEADVENLVNFNNELLEDLNKIRKHARAYKLAYPESNLIESFGITEDIFEKYRRKDKKEKLEK